jgi:hypothetical protein
MRGSGQRRLAQTAGWLWISSLALMLVLATRTAQDVARRTPELAYGCDSFGYLLMARQIRHAAAAAALPDFHLESTQTRFLIDSMKAQRARPGGWRELVAPHAHHYFPRADRVGVQYPPGTGLALAAFPEGEAVRRLSEVVAWTFLAIAGIALLLAGVRRAWASTGLVVLSLYLGLEMLVRLSPMSFSIAAVLLPVLLACLLTVGAAMLRGQGTPDRASARAAWIAALAAGAVLGCAVLVRIPSLLLLPGLLILLHPRSWREAARGTAGALVLGLILFGVIPLLLHQGEVAGSWHLPTYSRADASLPSLRTAGRNLAYFFGDGPGSSENWALLPAIAGLLGCCWLARLSAQSSDDARALEDLAASRRRRLEGTAPLSLRRVSLAALAIWAASTAFFVTHEVTTPYYLAPGTFGAVALLGFGALAVEARRCPVEGRRPGGVRRLAALAAIVLALVPGVATAARARGLAALAAPGTALATPIALPPELADQRAWVYADLLSGSLWYYAGKPAFKISFSNADTRALLYRFVFDRGEPQYVIRDSDGLEPSLEEIEQLGGALEPRGRVGGQPYFHIRWPESGPGRPQAPVGSSQVRR